MKIAVFGNYGVKNLGDDLILKGLQVKYPGDELMVFCGNPEQVQKQFGLSSFSFFPGGVKSFLRWLRSSEVRLRQKKAFEILQQSDLIIIGGGGILVDCSLKAVVLWWMQLRTILKSGTPFEFDGNSFELKHWWSKALFSPFLKKASTITVRDLASQRFLQDLGLKAGYEEDLSSLVPLDLQRHPTKKISFALCQWGIDDAILKAFQNFLRIKKSEGYDITFLAFQLTGDDDRLLYQKIDPALEVKTTLEAILQAMGESEVLISMRYHATLLGLRFGIPTAAISYQEKVTRLMEEKGLKDLCVPIQKIDEQTLQELFQKAVEEAHK